MPRDLPIGNGKLMLCFDQDYAIRDLYFPHVGQENHLSGNPCRMGIWVDGDFSWVGPDWNRDLRYLPDTQVTDVRLSHNRLGILIECNDTVDFHENIYVRQLLVRNLKDQHRDVRLFFHHNFMVLGNNIGDTAAYDPATGGVVHYKGNRYFLTNAQAAGSSGLSQFATGQHGFGGHAGTFVDAEDGHLSGNLIAQGSVDSVIAVHLSLEGMSQGQAHYWISAGTNWDEVRRLDALVKHKTIDRLIKRTGDYWRLWVRKERQPLTHLPDKVGELYRRSLLVLSTHIDVDGGILASNDSDVIHYNRDTYSYVWPRDGALVADALAMAGYPFAARGFFEFMSQRIEKAGYFLHKYNPDGTLASSWHPWVDRNGQPQMPIQEDETALVLWALWKHFTQFRDLTFVKPYYKHIIKNAAEFMCRYRDEETGLPGESYDLWEEKRCISSFTVGAVFGGLAAASLFCGLFGEAEKAERYQKAAAQIRDAASRHLWRPEKNRFCRMLYRDNGGTLRADDSCDSSVWGLFAFGLYRADDPRIQSTMATLKEKLWAPTEIGGMARYENDYYCKVSDQVTGNPWLVCTLWQADYLIENARDETQLKEAVKIVEWVADRALPSGVMAEQVHPHTGQPVSVSPLSWSHAAFVATVLRLLSRMGEMKICPECHTSNLANIRGQKWIELLFSENRDCIHGLCGLR